MPLPSKIETQLYNFTNSKIVFEEEYNQYLFNEKWLIDVNENTFKESIRQILIDVNEYYALLERCVRYLYIPVTIFRMHMT
jgi:hypothetical protein